MRAVVLTEYGDTEVLRVVEVADPIAGPEEVLVEVVATALNRADLLQRRGLYPSPPLAGFPMPAPEIPGMEFAGRVLALGERVTTLAVGDEVMGIVGGGAYAERLVVHERQTMRVPSGVELRDAAAIPEVFITAYDALVVQGGLSSGRVALVHAGASGVGTAAIQIAGAIGARVIVTASGGKVAACESLGADLAIDYTTGDFVDAALGYTGGDGVDVIVDVIGGDYVNRNLSAIRVGGRIIQVGTMGGGRTDVNIGMLLPKRAAIIGTVLRARPLEEKIAITQRFAAEMLPLFDQGRLRPVIDTRFALDEIAAAHARMESNANVGKILIDVCD
ncbi:MAG: NAD(P)H-quinone oxidoreductase [Actinobacteria bacterium]|nr:NAD(P)H-quinone oxidoreductase [Actinomycetota bacterium]